MVTPSKMNKVFFIVLTMQLFSSAVFAGEFYRDNTKEVVVDKTRKLMWQDNAAANSTDKSYTDAKVYCDALDFAGYTDWYLPSVNELKSIVKAENYPRCIDQSFKHVYADYYWSSTEYSSEFAWIVLFIYEDVIYYHKTDPSHVRCVRKTK